MNIIITSALGLAALAIPALPVWAGDIVNAPPKVQVFEISTEGVGFAPLQGDRFAGAYMAMVRLPGGLVSPAHVKSANMFGVVISGTLTHRAVTDNASSEVRLPAGSFYRIPAGLAHVSSCVSAEECVTFLYQDGKFDFVPVREITKVEAGFVTKSSDREKDQ